ncbi:EF-hand calcium-binding domain-containing protein 5-like [Acropora millepora]|uniref:EF-hand calcium-binding domain-containing protein 5-like n=1 Tax=Acropora millepora TaxID=45264 RepID=UPI001CF5F5FD|nr:EF-hand calcium-binding domain-containing protein 5-like [Acropora millepora]
MAAAAAFTKEPIKATEFEFEVVDLGQDQDLEDGDVIRGESISPEQLGRDRSRSLSISEVMYHQLNGTDRMASPVVRAFTRSAVNRWRGNVEKKITKRLMEVKAERKKRDAESKELVRLVARTVPFDVLAKDWLNDNEITSEVRIYLLENLLPTLILGVEKLLSEVEKRDLAFSEGFCPTFNPIDFLAQFLMRNNPRFSNFAEASPYAKGIRKVVEDLKKEVFSLEDNKLAKLKAEAKKRREAREKEEHKKNLENRRRSIAMEEQFPEWTADWNGILPLSVVQNVLRSFQEEVHGNLPEEIRKGAAFIIPLEPTDTSGKMINMKEFKEYLRPYAGNLSKEAFNVFVEHLSRCAAHYRTATVREAMRLTLRNLFLSCDMKNAGLLDRKRILDILSSFYDNAVETIRNILQNPRKWPVLDVEEASPENEEYIPDTDGAETEQKTQEEAADNKEDGEAEENSTEEKVEGTPGVEERTEEQHKNKENTKGETAGEEIVQDDANNSNEEDRKEEIKKQLIDDEEEDKKLLDSIPDEIDDDMEQEDTETSASTLPRPKSGTEGSAFDENSLNQPQFIHLLEKFMGHTPVKHVFDDLVRFVRASYRETDDERIARMNKARMEARSAKRRHQVDALYELWDVNTSGYLELDEIQVVLGKWRTDGIENFKEALQVFSEVNSTLDKRSFRQCIDTIVKLLTDEDAFDSLIDFLTKSVERSFEERKRGDARKRWMTMIDAAAQTGGAQLDPVYRAVFHVLNKDAEEYGKGKIISASVSMLENNDDAVQLYRGETVLRYVACTVDDIPHVLGKILYRDMKAISWTVLDSGKPIHVPKVATHSGIVLWNHYRKQEGAEGSFIALPLKDHERRVIGILGIDTLADPHKAVFITHEISFFQGVAKALSQAIQFVDIRRKTLRVAESAVSWILRRSPNVQNVNVYLVEPGLKPSDGLVLRRMMTLGHNGVNQHYTHPPRLDRKDNLFRDYLFKCVESSETITADAYGERHMAFPLRDGEGKAVAVVDISIGELKALPPHENKEIQRMLRLLAIAHREVAREITSGAAEKNIVLEVEKEYEDARIDVLFDRLMLLDLRENVGRLDARAFAEIKSYKDPPKVIHDILKAVLGIFHADRLQQERFDEWSTCKQLVNADLVRLITDYDPTAKSNVRGVNAKSLAAKLQNVPQGAVAKHGSLPAQYLFNWAFVCLSLIEHTEKMSETRPGKVVSPAKSEVVTDFGKGRPSPQDTSTRSEGTD